MTNARRFEDAVFELKSQQIVCWLLWKGCVDVSRDVLQGRNPLCDLLSNDLATKR